MIKCPSGKRRFRTREAAEISLSTIWSHQQAPGSPLPARAYHCDKCPYWHLTKMGSIPERYQPLTVEEPPEESRPRTRWETLGPRVQQAREAAGLSRDEVAAYVGVSVSTIQYLEYGGSRVSSARLQWIAELTGTTEEWLRYGGEHDSAGGDRSLGHHEDEGP
jgi:DNA-binding XRE family transcriptional regulator